MMMAEACVTAKRKTICHGWQDGLGVYSARPVRASRDRFAPV